MRNRIMGAFVAVLVAVGLGGCDSLEKGCTLIGCTDQLTVNLSRAGASSYQVDLMLDGKAAHFTCDNGTVRDVVGVSVTLCNAASFTIEGAPSEIQVSVPCGLGPDDAGVLDCKGTFTPTYMVSRPNGPDCGPECKQATVELQ